MHSRFLTMWPPPAFWLHLPPLCSHSAFVITISSYQKFSSSPEHLQFTLTLQDTALASLRRAIKMLTTPNTVKVSWTTQLPHSHLEHMNPWGISPSTSTGPGQICPKGKSWPSKMAYLKGKNILMNPINILGIYAMSCPGETYEERKWTLRKEDEITCC